jgi:hypothetical protein
LKIYTNDARNFLSSNNSQHNKNYDLIILDAYSKDYVPFHLMTLQYFQLLYNKLTPNGIIVSNQIGSLQRDTSNLYRAVYKTMTNVFPAVYVFPVEPDNNTVVQNIILVATKDPADIIYHSQSALRQQQMKLISDSKSNNNKSDYFKDDNVMHSIDYAQYFYDSAKIRTNDVPLLTDQYAPVENLLNPITGKSYNTDEQAIAPAATTATTNTRMDLHYTQNTSLLFSLVMPLVITSIWIFYMHHIWRKRTEEEEGSDLIYQ